MNAFMSNAGECPFSIPPNGLWNTGLDMNYSDYSVRDYMFHMTGPFGPAEIAPDTDSESTPGTYANALLVSDAAAPTSAVDFSPFVVQQRWSFAPGDRIRQFYEVISANKGRAGDPPSFTRFLY